MTLAPTSIHRCPHVPTVPKEPFPPPQLRDSGLLSAPVFIHCHSHAPTVPTEPFLSPHHRELGLPSSLAIVHSQQYPEAVKLRSELTTSATADFDPSSRRLHTHQTTLSGASRTGKIITVVTTIGSRQYNFQNSNL
jgi:hypothetical protein